MQHIRNLFRERGARDEEYARMNCHITSIQLFHSYIAEWYHHRSGTAPFMFAPTWDIVGDLRWGMGGKPASIS